MPEQIQLTPAQYRLIEYYTADEMKNLKKLVDKMLTKIGGIDDAQLDDYYSLANYHLLFAALEYDKEKCNSFKNFFKTVLDRKIKTHLRDIHIDRRCNKCKIKDVDTGEKITIYFKDKSLDAPIKDKNGNEQEDLYYDVFISPYSMSPEDLYFSEDVQNDSQRLGDKIHKFYRTLSEKQKKILNYKMNGYKKYSDIAKATGYSVDDIKDTLRKIEIKAQNNHIIKAA